MTPRATATADATPVFDPMDPATLADPYLAYRALRDHHPVAHLEPLDLWAVSRHADVREALAAPESFSAALAFGKDAVITDRRSPGRQLSLRFAGDAGAVVSSSDGADHARLRRTVARLLSKPRLDAVDRSVQALVDRLVGQLRAEQAEFDMVTALAKPVAGHAIGRLMGLDEPVTASLTAWVELTARALDPGDQLSTAAAASQLMRANLACVRAVAAFLRAETRTAPAGPPNGLVEAWRTADRPAEREEVILSVLQLFQAGFETITAAICYLTDRFLLDPPGGPARPLAGLARPDSLALVIDEGLRLASPVRATVRTAVGRQEIAGVTVPDGANVLLLLGSANRDERVFPDPDRALPGRPAHLAFGSGPHRCLGRYLAHVELTHLLSALATHARHLEAAPGARISANILKAGYASLPVRADWR